MDGAVLSAPYDPAETRRAPAAPPPTEIMSPAQRPAEIRSPLQSTIRAPAPPVPLWKSDEPVHELRKKSNAPRLIRWAFLVRGLTGIVIGIVTFVLSAKVESESLMFELFGHHSDFVLFGAYGVVGGGCSLVAGWRTWVEQQTGWLLLLDAVVGVVWGLLLLWQYPDWLLPLSVGLAAWPIATGVLQTGATFQLRKFLTTPWLLALAGVVSFLCGLALSVIVALLSRPYLSVRNLVRIMWLIAAYAVISGVLLAIFGFTVRARHEKNT